MPFTEKQRRYFHAAAERGEKGMTALASEADQLTKQGKELPPVKESEGGEMPEHVVESEDGRMSCMHCGGEVYPHGGSMHPADEGGAEDDDTMGEEGLHKPDFMDAVSYSRHRRGQ